MRRHGDVLKECLVLSLVGLDCHIAIGRSGLDQRWGQGSATGNFFTLVLVLGNGPSAAIGLPKARLGGQYGLGQSLGLGIPHP